MQLTLFAVFGVVMGAICLVNGAYNFFITNLEIRGSVAVTGIVTDKFNTYRTANNGDRYPEYNVQFAYLVDGTRMSGTRQVDREFFDRTALNQPITVYYPPSAPAGGRINFDGLFNGPRTMVGIGAVIFILGLVVLGLMYRYYFSPTNS